MRSRGEQAHVAITSSLTTFVLIDVTPLRHGQNVWQGFVLGVKFLNV